MNRNVIIADSIRYQQQWYAMDIWMQQTLKRIDVSKLLIYFIDTVDAAVLPFLAQEFDVLGIKGWDFATTEAQQRALIKKAVQLHKYKGTPWAVEQVVAQAGYVDAVLVERCGTDPVTGWAIFRIEVDITANPFDGDMVNTATLLVNAYKRQSSLLDGIYFTGLNFNDDVDIKDGTLLTDAGDVFGDGLTMTGSFLYDGSVAYDGSRNYCQDSDTIVINLI